MGCAVPNCDYDSKDSSKAITYHRFPSEPMLRAAWLEALHMSDWQLQEHSAVCCSHFRPEDLLVNSSGRREVRAGAVPTVYLQVCRICFATKCNLYSLKTHEVLYKAYETLTGLLNEDSLPPYICSECARRLLNCDRFRTTCLQAHSVLLDIVKSNGYITLNLIQSVKRSQCSLSSNTTDSYDRTDNNLESKLREEEDTLFNSRREDMQKIRENIADNNVEAEYDVVKQEIIHIEDEAIDDIYLHNSAENIAENDIKIENEGVVSQDACDTQSTSLDEMGRASSLPKYIIFSEIKIENVDVVNEDWSIEDSRNADMRNEIDIENQVKVVEKMDKGSTEESRIATAKLEHLVAGEGCCSSNGLTLASVKQQAGTTTGVQVLAEEKLDMRQHSSSYTAVSRQYNSYLCNICNRAFTQVCDLTTHMNTHTEKISCNINKLFNSTSLASHVGTHNAEKLPAEKFACGVCNKTITSKSNLIKHMGIHSCEKSFSCGVCNKRFNYKGNLKSHIRTHTGEKPFSCDVCHKTFRNKNNLTTHRGVHSYEKPFSCDVCNKTFKHESSMRNHIRIHTGEKPFSCDLCNESFRLKDNLKYHIRTHTDEKLLSCHVCNKKFSTISSLTTHIGVHSCEKPFSCDVCRKAFRLKGNLQIHIRSHTGEKLFSCDVCNKTFSTKSILTKHIKVHSGEKPFSCELCKKAFKGMDGLKYHITTHTGKKPFSCDLCSKTFSKKRILNIHIRTHIGERAFSCNVCNKTCISKCDLIKHMRVHSFEKPFSCNLCNKAFKGKSGLKYHMTTHTDEKPFSCGVCNKSFKIKSLVRQHMKTHSA